MKGQYGYPFQKWNKDKIVEIINKSSFVFKDEYAGNFSFYYKEDIFKNSYILYLHKTRIHICNPNVAIYRGIRSYKQLNKAITQEYKERTK